METKTIYTVKEIRWAEKTFAIIRAKLGFDKLQGFFAASYKELYEALGKSGVRPAAPPLAIYFSVDTATKETDLAAAVVVPSSWNAPAEVQKLTIPASKALLVTYYGSYENMTPVYQALDQYAAKNNLEKLWVLEEYFSDPASEPDPAKWKTNIYYILK